MKWSISYKSFVKVSLFNTLSSLIKQSIPMDPKQRIIKGLHCTILVGHSRIIFILYVAVKSMHI